jgi:metal transporter CNNM
MPLITIASSARHLALLLLFIVPLVISTPTPGFLVRSSSISNSSDATGCLCGSSVEQKVEPMLPLMVTLPIIAVLVMLSGLFSGLTLGLMGLDNIMIQTVKNGDNKELAQCAARIAPVRERGNQLLCTLLLGNVAVNSLLSVLMADISSGLIGFLVSTVLIVIFGEIMPQAACSRYALQVGSATVPVVKMLLCLFYVVTKPMAVALDWMLGKDIGVIYSSSELIEMVKLQVCLGADDMEAGRMAKQVVEGAVNFREKRVVDVMTPLNDAYMLSIDTRLGYDTIREIFHTGFSRVPVYGRDKHDYRGLLYTKDLMLADPEDEMKLGDFIKIFDRRANTFTMDTRLVDALNVFKKGQTHLALVREMVVEDAANARCELRGVLTLEDVVEEILQEEIVDETDVYVDVDNQVIVNDGREKKRLNLEVFNPVWRMREDRLSREEVKAIAAHLSRTTFTPETEMNLDIPTIEWLINGAEVRNRSRSTQPGVQEPDARDYVYRSGMTTDHCMLVLQGRVGLRVGREGFRSEVGAFSLLARDAIRPDLPEFAPDFSAFVSTPKVRFLLISKAALREAQALDLDTNARDQALLAQATQASGEDSRKEARQLTQHLLPEQSRPLQGGLGKSPSTYSPFSGMSPAGRLCLPAPIKPSGLV